MIAGKAALSVAGSDPGGGAGLQADIRTFNFLGIYGLSAVSALTAQNSVEVRGFLPVPGSFLQEQLEAITDDLALAATKCGMLSTPENVSVVADFARKGVLGPLVVDPVLTSTSGQPLASGDLAEALRRLLLPVCALVTPNLDEASRLTGKAVRSARQAAEAARQLVDMGAGAACVTGGHLDGTPIDVLYDGDSMVEIAGTRIAAGERFHGTGCLFSAAITAKLALGEDLAGAVEAAKRLVEAGLRNAIRPGAGMSVPWPRA